jgi:hypothetical protein
MKIGLLVKTANDRVTNSTRPYQTIRAAGGSGRLRQHLDLRPHAVPQGR